MFALSQDELKRTELTRDVIDMNGYAIKQLPQRILFALRKKMEKTMLE